VSLTATARSIPGTLRQEVVMDACPLRRSIEAGIEFVERLELRREPEPRREPLSAAGRS
jgi:hypothetical protein